MEKVLITNFNMIKIVMKVQNKSWRGFRRIKINTVEFSKNENLILLISRVTYFSFSNKKTNLFNNGRVISDKSLIKYLK